MIFMVKYILSQIIVYIRAVNSYFEVTLVRDTNLLNFIARTYKCYSYKLSLKHCVCSFLYYLFAV
jgi:hypothetical protein